MNVSDADGLRETERPVHHAESEKMESKDTIIMVTNISTMSIRALANRSWREPSLPN